MVEQLHKNTEIIVEINVNHIYTNANLVSKYGSYMPSTFFIVVDHKNVLCRRLDYVCLAIIVVV